MTHAKVSWVRAAVRMHVAGDGLWGAIVQVLHAPVVQAHAVHV